MNMRITTEVPNHVWTFNLPHVPNSIVSDIQILVPGEVKSIKAACFDELHRFLNVFTAEWCENVCHDFSGKVFLVCSEKPGEES